MKYPLNFKKSNYANRGMNLEADINMTNTYYKEKDMALIYKKPTPIHVTKIDYQNHNKIKDAFFEAPSTLDYNGVYNGKYIEFDAKETTSKTSFPISNIHKHQIDHIQNVLKHQGIVFLIVRFVSLDENYILLGRDLINFLNNSTRKSIPYEYFKTNGYPIKIKYSPRLDYLQTIKTILEDL